MFGVFSFTSIALAALYFLGFVMMMRTGIRADMSWMKAFCWAAVWPLTAWPMLTALWKTTPPAE